MPIKPPLQIQFLFERIRRQCQENPDSVVDYLFSTYLDSQILAAENKRLKSQLNKAKKELAAQKSSARTKPKLPPKLPSIWEI